MDMYRYGHTLATGVAMRMEDTRIYAWSRRPALKLETTAQRCKKEIDTITCNVAVSACEKGGE